VPLSSMMILSSACAPATSCDGEACALTARCGTQIIRESKEELDSRQELWRSIQKKAEDPTTVRR
jgi:hypothetical protein